jgi:nitroreductase
VSVIERRLMEFDRDVTDRLLTRTRSTRLRLDRERPVPLSLIEECLQIALQAPTGGNVQVWRWLVVTDPEQRSAIGHWYRLAWAEYAKNQSASRFPPDDPRHEQFERSMVSAQHLADHFHEIPALVVPCVQSRMEGMPFGWVGTMFASVLPAAWSFMLAARTRGLGSTLTTLTLMNEREVAEILGLPDDVTHCAMVPVAYYMGQTFSPARRLPLRAVAYHDRWGTQLPD